jgi:voltage-gated potassium channel Kch
MGTVLVWGDLSIDRSRSVVWAIIGFVEVSIGFAGLYLYSDSLGSFNKPLQGVVDSIYFSLVTSTTVGFGDIYPIRSGAKLLVSAHLALSFVMVVFAFSILVGRLQGRPRSQTPSWFPNNK